MPHDHSSSKQSRLGVRANPLGTSTPSQKPLLRLLRAAGRWLQGAAWSWAWVAFSEVRSTAGVPGCPRRARREIWSLSGSPCPANNLCSCFASSPEMRGSCCGEERSCGLWGREVPRGLLPAPAACSVQAAAPCWLSCHPLTVYVSPTASFITHCWLHHPLPTRAPTSHPAGTAVTSQGSFSRFSFSYSKHTHVGIDCKPVPTQAKSQSWDGEKAPGTARLPGTTAEMSTSGVQAAGFRAVREGQED